MHADADSLQRDTVVSVGSSKGDRRPNRVAFNGGSVNLPYKPSNALSRATRKESSGKDGIFGLQRNLRRGMKSSEWHLKNLLDGINKALKRVADSESYLISRIVRTILWCTLYLFVTRSMTRECNSEGLVEAICGPTGAEPCDWVISFPFEWQRVWFDSVERVFLWMVNVDWCMCYYVARNKSEYFKSVACWTDILTMPAFSLLFWFGSKAANTDFDADTYFVRYGFIRFLRLYGMEPTFEILFPNMSMTRRQVLSIALGVLSLLLMFSGAIFNEESCTMGRKDYFVTYEDFVYFLIITMSTVGYGDFSPITLRGRILVLVFIALTLSLVTLQVKKLMLILAEDNIQYGVAPSSSLYYILMVCDRVDLVLIQSLIKELYTTELYEGAPPVLVITTTELPHERTCKKLNETCTALGIHLYVRRFDFASAYHPPSLNATAGENTSTTTSSSSASSSASGNKNKIIVYATMLGGTNTLPIRLDLAAAIYILTPPPSSGPLVTSAVPSDSHLYSTTASSVNSGNSDGAVEDKMTYLRILALGRIFTPSTAGARDVLFREEMMGRIVVITNTKEFDAMIRSQGVAGVLCVSEFRQQLIARHCAGIKGFPTLVSNLVSKFDRIPPPPQQQQISYTTKRSQGDTQAMPDPTSPVTPPVSEAGTVKTAAAVPGGMSLKEEASGFADYCRGAQYRLMVIHCPPIDNEEVDDEEVGPQGEGQACSAAAASSPTYMIRYKRAVEHLYHSYNVLLLGLLVPPSAGEVMVDGEGGERKLLINPDPETIFSAPLLYEVAEGLQEGNDDEDRRPSNADIGEEKSYVDLLVLCDSEATLDTLQYYASWPPSCVTKVKKKTTRSTRSSQFSSARHSTLSGGRPDHPSKGHRSSYASQTCDDDDDDDGCISVTYEDDLPAVFPNTDDTANSPGRRDSSARWNQHRMTVSEALSPRPAEGASSLSRLSSASNPLLSNIRASPSAPRRCPIGCDGEDGDDFASACFSLELQRARVLQRLFKGVTATSARRKTKTLLTTSPQRPSTQSIVVDEQGPAMTEAMGGKSGRPAEDTSMGKSAASSSSLLALPSLDSTQQQQQPTTKTSDEEGFLDYGLECSDVTQALGRYARYVQQPSCGEDSTSVPASPNTTLPPRIILLLGYQARTLPRFLHDLFKSLPRPPQPQHGSISALSSQGSSSPTACSNCGRPLPLVVCLSPVSPVNAILNDPTLSATTASFHINVLNSYIPYFSYIRGSIDDDVDLLRAGLNLAHTVCIFNSPPTPPLDTRQGAQQQSLPHHQHSPAAPTLGMTSTSTPGTAYPPPPTRTAPINPVDNFGMFSPMKTTVATAMAGANTNALQPASFGSQGLGGSNHVKSDDEVVVALWTARSVLMMVKAGSGQKASSSRRSSTTLNDKTQDEAEGSREQQQGEDDEEQKAVPKSPAGHRLTLFSRQASMVSGRRSEFHSKRSSTAASGATSSRSRSFGRLKSSTLHGGLGKGASAAQTTGMLSNIARLLRWRTAGKRGKNLVKRVSMSRPRRDSIIKASYRATLVGGPSSSSSTDIIHRFGNAANPHKAAALVNALQQSIIFTTCSTLPPAALQPPMLLELADHRSIRLADVSRWTPDGGGVPNFRESAEYASGRIVTNAAFQTLICQLPGVSSHMLTIDIVRQFICGLSFGGGHTFNLVDCPVRHWAAPFSRVFFDLYDEGTICIGVYRGAPVFDTPLQCLPFVLTCPRPNLAMTPGDQLYIIPRGAAYTIW
ncbi:hypothetical protein FOZ63_007820 [Perkinsus olseni]|uniref:Potassium channel domain-containing protein n=1 Tax=Perkinsus olseni TaxID=32597 RepID=A0A7J6QMG2_PEROL|nr:hypothetical protein FOZ63_007820 [Perkinsus olseni]